MELAAPRDRREGCQAQIPGSSPPCRWPAESKLKAIPPKRLPTAWKGCPARSGRSGRTRGRRKKSGHGKVHALHARRRKRSRAGAGSRGKISRKYRRKRRARWRAFAEAAQDHQHEEVEKASRMIHVFQAAWCLGGRTSRKYDSRSASSGPGLAKHRPRFRYQEAEKRRAFRVARRRRTIRIQACKESAVSSASQSEARSMIMCCACDLETMRPAKVSVRKSRGAERKQSEIAESGGHQLGIYAAPQGNHALHKAFEVRPRNPPNKDRMAPHEKYSSMVNQGGAMKRIAQALLLLVFGCG